jgi:hypothetical protein
MQKRMQSGRCCCKFAGLHIHISDGQYFGNHIDCGKYWVRSCPRSPARRSCPRSGATAKCAQRCWRPAALITAEEAERRVLVLENPSLRGQSCITKSLYAGLQLILPGEIAPTP